MKVLVRCALAVVAVFGCLVLLLNKPDVHAQSCCTNSYCLPPTPACPTPICDYFGGCDWQWECDSPILIDVTDQGFHLTNQANGVMFKFFGSAKQQVAWTDPNYGNAWLALDRNGNGTIDDATELFGNDTPQPASPNPNGFLALAVYDLPENGGTAMASLLHRTDFTRNCSCGRTRTKTGSLSLRNFKASPKQALLAFHWITT